MEQPKYELNVDLVFPDSLELIFFQAPEQSENQILSDSKDKHVKFAPAPIIYRHSYTSCIPTIAGSSFEPISILKNHSMQSKYTFDTSWILTVVNIFLMFLFLLVFDRIIVKLF